MLANYIAVHAANLMEQFLVWYGLTGKPYSPTISLFVALFCASIPALFFIIPLISKFRTFTRGCISFGGLLFACTILILFGLVSVQTGAKFQHCDQVPGTIHYTLSGKETVLTTNVAICATRLIGESNWTGEPAQP